MDLNHFAGRSKMRHFFERDCKQSVVIAAVVGLLCGCNQSPNTAGQPTANAEQNGQNGTPVAGQTSGAKADFQVEPLPKSGASGANWGSDKDASPKAPTFERGRLLSRPGAGSAGGGGGPAVDPWVAQYSKFRVEKAAVIRNYAHVSVMPVGIDAFVKTAWTSGNVHIRLALLGPLNNLKTFNETQRDVKLTFQDRAGNPLQVIIVPMDQMKQAPQSANYGTPTYVVEGSMECPLELYEEYYQWMFEWE